MIELIYYMTISYITNMELNPNLNLMSEEFFDEIKAQFQNAISAYGFIYRN
jgi:hypothetical protein